MSNTYTQNIIVKPAKFDIPKGLLEAALKAYPSCAGIAIAANPSDQDVVMTFLQSSSPPIAEVMKVLDQNTDTEVVLFLGNFPDKFTDKNIQPINVLFDADGKPTMVGFISGEIVAKNKASDESPQLQFFNRYIVPHVTKAEKANGDDLSATFLDIHGDDVYADLMSTALDDSTVVLFTNHGSITLGKKPNEFSWGWCTDACGYTEAAKPQIAANKSSGFGANLRPAGLKTEPKTDTSQVSLPDADTAGKETAVDGPGLEGADWEWGAPPSSYTKNQKREFYQQAEIWDNSNKKYVKGVAPENYKDCPKVKIKKGAIKSLQDIPKDHVKPVEPSVTSEVLPVTSPKSIEWLKNNLSVRQHVQKTLNEGTVVIDPKRAKRMEDEWPSFVESGGLKDLRIAMAFTSEDYADIIRETPDAALVLMEDLVLFMYNTLKQRNDLNFPGTKLSEAEKHILASTELKPAAKATGTGGKGGGFGNTLKLPNRK